MKTRTQLLAFAMLLAARALLGPTVLAQSTYEPYTFTTLAGSAGSGSADGTGSAARFDHPRGVAVDSAGNVYVADSENNTIRKVTPTGVVTAVAGMPPHSNLQYDNNGNLVDVSSGSADGTGSTARFDHPRGVAVDSAGNVYVADSGNNTIRKLTPAGVVTTLAGLAGSAGSTDGMGSTARFWNPASVAVDSAGNVYVADSNNTTIRKVTPAGVVTTLAGLAGSAGSTDGTGSAARFWNPASVAVDSAGNVYAADSNNTTIRKVTPAGVVTTLAGLAGSADSTDGTGSAARFDHPLGVAVDSAGNVYVADSENNTIRKVTSAGVVTTLAGEAQGHPVGNSLGGSTDGTGSDARFWNPASVAVDSAGNVYVADSENNTIRKVTSAGVVTTLAGEAQGHSVGNSLGGSTDGTGSDARFWNPASVAVDSAGNVYVADSENNTIRKVTSAGVVTTLAGLAPQIQHDNSGSIMTDSSGSADGKGSAARFNEPTGVAVDSAGNVYVADSENNAIRKVTSAGVVTTLAGKAEFDFPNCNSIGGNTDGTGSAARFSGPSGVAVGSAGNVYVADTFNYTIRKVTPAGVVTTLAGLAGNAGSADGTGSAARFSGPMGLAVDSAGNIYVAETATIRKVTPAGVVTTLAGMPPQYDDTGNLVAGPGSADGTGSDARFGAVACNCCGCGIRGPFGVAVDNAGNVYVADSNNYAIRKVTPAGVVTTLAGMPPQYDDTGILVSGGPGSADGTGSDVRFGTFVNTAFDIRTGPAGVAVDGAGNVYVADTGNNTIRKGYPAPRILTSAPSFGFSNGHFGFNLRGPAGRLVVVETSPDLTSWLPIWTNTITFPAALSFSEPQSRLYSNRFYRAHLP